MERTKTVDDALFQYATVRQVEFLEAIAEHGSLRAAAKAMGVNYGTVRAALESVKAKAASSGYSPEHDMTRPVAPGYMVKGNSTLYRRGEVEPVLQWVKSTRSQEAQDAMMRAAIDAMSEDIPRLQKMPVPRRATLSHLCNCYVITDHHLSMLAHREETGDDWDTKIAERAMVDWFAQAIAQSPDAETAVFAQLSDLLHSDSMEALTPASKHLLDVDTRFFKVVRTVIRVLRKVIDMLLAKHKRLHIIMADSNHDPVSQIWLREWIAVLYENEPRITVDRTPSPYNAFEFGKVALFFHHGHKRKVTNVSEVFAAQFREMFGRTKYAYAHMGHLHHIDIKENNLMIVEQHRTLAARDAYSARAGFLSGRDATVISYHRDFGEVSRLTINSDMLRVAEAA